MAIGTTLTPTDKDTHTSNTSLWIHSDIQNLEQPTLQLLYGTLMLTHQVFS